VQCFKLSNDELHLGNNPQSYIICMLWLFAILLMKFANRS